MNKCTQCGVCCKIFLITLTKEEYKSGRYKTVFEEFGFVEDFKEAERDGVNILAQNDDASCIYLKDKKCLIHENKPSACTKFFCGSKDPEFAVMIKKIEEYKSKFC
jgi:Fe-S-cluster containining protein